VIFSTDTEAWAAACVGYLLTRDDVDPAAEHIGLDHLPHVSTFIADWVADTLAERAARPPQFGGTRA